jgi:hypothetical protein
MGKFRGIFGPGLVVGTFLPISSSSMGKLLTFIKNLKLGVVITLTITVTIVCKFFHCHSNIPQYKGAILRINF